MKADVNKRSIGVNFISKTSAEVRVWAPKADKVSIFINEREQVYLKRDDFGYWSGEAKNLRPDDKYQFIVDGKKRPDPAALAQEDSVHGLSLAKDLSAFSWEDHNWQNIPLQDYLIYELHTGTFTPQGTFQAIENKLDYLLELGINVIEIMPVAQFPGKRNWGYDGVLPFAVQNSYGGAESLQHLVNACHKKGIAVILDVVYNHIGPEGNYFEDFGPYFTDKYHTPWGNALNFDDAWCDGVRNFFIENALMWFRDFHIDALRLDAVHAIKDFSPVHILKEIKLHVNELMSQTGRKYHLIVEVDLNDTRFIDPLEEHGFGMDAQWIDEFHHALRVASGQEQSGYYADFNGLQDLAKSYQDAYVYDGQYSSHRHRHFGIKTQNPGKQFVVFSQNHDQVGNRMLGERTSQLLSFEMQKLLPAAVLLSPFLPMLFMGEEWSEPHPFLYFVSHTDPELADAVRKGRKAEFAAFHAEGEAPDPSAEETFEQSKLQWHLLDQEPHKTMYNYYQEVIRLRKQHPILREPERNGLTVNCDDKTQVLELKRARGPEVIICLMNFSKKDQNVVLSENKYEWRLLLNSAAAKWNGSFEAEQKISDKVIIGPESVLIYEKIT